MKRRRDTKKKRERKRDQRQLRAEATPRPIAAGTDAAATPEVRSAMLQSERLLRLVKFPVQGESKVQPEPRVQYNWDIAGPAMLFSASSCLLSIRLLAESRAPRREQDAIVLLRRLYEHVVDFAWIAIAPAINAKKWLADDYEHRIKVDNEFARLGQPALEAAKRSTYEQFIAANRPGMPDLASRADAADKHWSTQIHGHGVFPSKLPADANTLVNVQGGFWSLRVQYAIIYRLASANAIRRR